MQSFFTLHCTPSALYTLFSDRTIFSVYYKSVTSIVIDSYTHYLGKTNVDEKNCLYLILHGRFTHIYFQNRI